MRFHVVALPHTQTHSRHEACAFTTKVLRFCAMMKALGYTVFHYGAEGSEVECDEHVSVLRAEEQLKFFGPWDSTALYDLDWSGQAEYWQIFNRRTVAAIQARKEPGDFLCLIMGTLNRPIAQMVPDLKAVEYGIGYNGTFADFRVFESYSHMHRILGQTNPHRDMDGQWYSAVIPNYYPVNAFPYQPNKDDYFLFIGRLVQRKGIHVAVETCKRLGTRLVVAGQGVKSYDGNTLICMDGMKYENVDYRGPQIGAEKVELMGSAKAVMCPTVYVEPFCGVAVEAQLLGTPVITTDWGAFTETVEHGKTGYRCRTLDHFVWAAKNVDRLDIRYIHNRAAANYSMDRIKWMYQEYFSMLADLRHSGWYAERPERRGLDWLRRY